MNWGLGCEAISVYLTKGMIADLISIARIYVGLGSNGLESGWLKNEVGERIASHLKANCTLLPRILGQLKIEMPESNANHDTKNATKFS